MNDPDAKTGEAAAAAFPKAPSSDRPAAFEKPAAKPAAAAKPLSPDEAVRWHAATLCDAIEAARSAGYVVDLPFRPDALGRIAISETAKVRRR